MRVCFFALEHHALGSGGGIASYLDALAPALTGLGHEIHIIVKGRAHQTSKLANGSFLHEFRGSNVHWYLSKLPVIGKILSLPIREIEWSWGFYRTLRTLKEETRLDLIESSETGNLFTALLEKKIPLVIRLHGSTYSFEKATKGAASLGAKMDRLLQRISFRKAKGISAPSEFQKTAFETEMGEGFSLKIIPNPGSADTQQRVDEITDDGRKIIFFAGRIADVKGVWTLLKAFVRIVEDHPQARLIMAGSPHVSISGDGVTRFLADHRLTDKVEFVGHVQKEKMGEYYERCAMYAAPSYYETFCISAIEAMLHGKPVVASAGTSLEEIVENGKTGLLVPPGDATALAEAILRLLNDEGLARSMGEAGREKAAQYQPAFIAKKTLEFYKNVVAGKT